MRKRFSKLKSKTTQKKKMKGEKMKNQSIILPKGEKMENPSIILPKGVTIGIKKYSISLPDLKKGYQIADNLTRHIYNMSNELGGSIEVEILITPNPIIDLDLLLEVEKRPLGNLDELVDPFGTFVHNRYHLNPCLFLTVKGIEIDLEVELDNLYNKDFKGFRNSGLLNSKLNESLIDFLSDSISKKTRAKFKSSVLIDCPYVDPYINYKDSEFFADYESSLLMTNIRTIKTNIPIEYLDLINGVTFPYKVGVDYAESIKDFSISNKFIFLKPTYSDMEYDYSTINYYTYNATRNCIEFPDRLKTSMEKISKGYATFTFVRPFTDKLAS